MNEQPNPSQKLNIAQKLKENKKTTAVIIVLALILIISLISSGAFGGGSKDDSNNNSKQETSQNLTPEVKNAVDKVNKIENQTITKIIDNKVILSNGSEIVLEPNTRIECQVDDKIIDYDDTKKALVCQSPRQETRYQTVPTQGFNGSGILTNLLLWDYVSNRVFARNNGYNNGYNQPNYNQNNNSNKSTNDWWRGNTNTTTNTNSNNESKTDTTKNTDTNSTKSGGTTTKTTGGHGGGFGGTTTGAS
jgi:hypothetical protein